MNIQELTTWNRLSGSRFRRRRRGSAVLGAAGSRQRLVARAFAARAIEEYRKFCFLAVHAGHPVTPSDEVDQVWHLHLTYSRHYWDALCRDTLEKPLHHGPTQGGVAEDRKFHDWYDNTLASYRRYFGEPPKDLWPAARERFHERNDFVRINRRDVVTIDRTVLKRGALASLAGGGVLAVAHALAQVDGAAEAPPDISFVAVLAVALIVAFILAFLVAAARSRRRKSGGAAAHVARAKVARATAPWRPSVQGVAPLQVRVTATATATDDGGSSGCGSGGSSGCGGGGGGGCGGGS